MHTETGHWLQLSRCSKQQQQQQEHQEETEEKRREEKKISKKQKSKLINPLVLLLIYESFKCLVTIICILLRCNASNCRTSWLRKVVKSQYYCSLLVLHNFSISISEGYISVCVCVDIFLLFLLGCSLSRCLCLSAFILHFIARRKHTR